MPEQMELVPNSPPVRYATYRILTLRWLSNPTGLKLFPSITVMMSLYHKPSGPYFSFKRLHS